MKKATFKILNLFKEEVLLKGFINVNEFNNEDNLSFCLYDNDNIKDKENDFYIIYKNELIIN